MKKLVFYLNLGTEKPKFVHPELLLHPPIPWPLWGVNPRRIEGTKWWNKTRKEAFRKNNNCCHACGVHRLETKEQWLEGHETYDIDYDAKTQTYMGTVGLCRLCHQFIHCGRSFSELEKFGTLFLRGQRLLEAAGLTRPSPPPAPSLPGGWRMIYKGKEYYHKGSFVGNYRPADEGYICQGGPDDTSSARDGT